MHAHHAEVWGPMGHRSQVLRAPETLPSGRAAVLLFWLGSTASANRKHSVRNFPAILEGARTSCRGPPKFRRFVRTSQTPTFLKNDSLKKRRISEKYKSSAREIPDSAYAELQRPRATCPPRTYRFRILAAVHMRELRPSIDEFVSPR